MKSSEASELTLDATRCEEKTCWRRTKCEIRLRLGISCFRNWSICKMVIYKLGAVWQHNLEIEQLLKVELHSSLLTAGPHPHFFPFFAAFLVCLPFFNQIPLSGLISTPCHKFFIKWSCNSCSVLVAKMPARGQEHLGKNRLALAPSTSDPHFLSSPKL